MKFSVRLLLLFLVLNFGALALGSWLMGDPATNDWYQSSRKAPWTPPGWVFGAAWFTIMALFAVFMTVLLGKSSHPRPLIVLYAIQWMLNVSWNPVFFVHHLPLTGLLILLALLAVLVILFVRAYKLSKPSVWLLIPYILWMCIAVSMDAYLWYMN